MCGRLQYYCLVQIISRIGATWYQLQYGFIETIDMSNASNFEMAVFSTQFILTPSAGIGYLIVFLTMQPEAYQHYKDLIKSIEKFCHCKLCSICLDESNQSNESKFCKYCCFFSSLSQPKKIRKIRYRLSEDTVTTIEQRLVEDIKITNNNNNDDDFNTYEMSSGSGNEYKQQSILRDIQLSRDSFQDNKNRESYSSSYFVDDQDFDEELERMFREGKCGIVTVN